MMAIFSFRNGWATIAFVLSSFFVAGGLVQAAAPQLKSQAPGYYRMMLGQFEITALYDGDVEIETKLLRNAGKREVKKLLEKQFIAMGPVSTSVNAYLINTGEKLILVDAGAGHLFGDALGFLASNLKTAGYAPEEVDVVLLTHLHGDHVGGLVTEQGEQVFPNALLYASDKEQHFWLSEESIMKAPEGMKPFFEMAQKALAPYQKNGMVRTFKMGETLFEGVTTVAAPGHTPGHTSFLIESGGQRLLFWGDIVHNAAVQFARPEVAIDFDVDDKMAVRTRQKLFARVAREKLMVAGMHLSFPGIGHVRRENKGQYAWVPVAYSPLRKNKQ